MSDDHVSDPAAADDWAFGDGGFAKIYGDRLAQSSLLDCAVATRWVFFWVLSQSNADGRYRCASIAALARAANVSLAQARKAIAELEAPDAVSTTVDHEGRRIQRIPGGWQILNYAKYRDFQTQRQRADAEKKKRQREKAKAEEESLDKRKADLAKREETVRKQELKAHQETKQGDMSRDVPGTSALDVRRKTSNAKRKTENGRRKTAQRTETDSGAGAPAPGPPPAKGNGTDAMKRTAQRAPSGEKHPKATTTATTGGRVLSVDVLPPGDPSTWSREAADDWEAAYEGKPPGAFFGQLKPIARLYGWERVRPVLRLVLAETPIEYLNLPKVLGGSFEALERRLPQGPRVRGQRPTRADGDRDALAAWARGTAS